MKIIENIKKWYNSLPDTSSKQFQLDKHIIKSTLENLGVSLCIVLVGILTSFLNNGLGMSAVLLGVGVFFKDILRITIKFIKDFSNIK